MIADYLPLLSVVGVKGRLVAFVMTDRSGGEVVLLPGGDAWLGVFTFGGWDV